MAFLEKKYTVEPGPHGTAIITVTGRCTDDEAAAVEGNCTRRFSLAVFANANGVVLKSLDGTTPNVVKITPPTMGGTRYECVKIEGRATPFAYEQTEGPYVGKAILKYMMRYQQVGAVS